MKVYVGLLLVLVAGFMSETATSFMEDDPGLTETELYMDEATMSLYREQHGDRRKLCTGCITVATYFHVVHDSGLGDLSNEDVAAQIDVLNAAYEWTPIRFNLEGISHSDSPDLFDRSLYDEVESFQYALGDILQVAGRTKLNIYSVDFPSPVAGSATYPSSFAGKKDGVFIDYCTIPTEFKTSKCTDVAEDNGLVLVHEVGHWLGLLHTFQGGCDYTRGDFVLDTSPQDDGNIIYDVQCATPSNSCPEISSDADPLSNYMSYSIDCWNEFTVGQMERMEAQWQIYREGTGACPDGEGLLSAYLNLGNEPEENNWLLVYADGHLISQASFAPSESEDTIISVCAPYGEPLYFGLKDEAGNGLQGPDRYYTVRYDGKLIRKNQPFGLWGGVAFTMLDDCLDDESLVAIELVLDGSPSETSWKIIDDEGASIYQEPPYYLYDSPSHYEYATVRREMCLLQGTYTFQINDSFGDGLSSNIQDISSLYSVSVNEMELVRNTAFFGEKQEFSFDISATTAAPMESDPSQEPSTSPSAVPTSVPTKEPSATRSFSPPDIPSLLPSDIPSLLHSDIPSLSPSDVPSLSPSVSPSAIPTAVPSKGAEPLRDQNSDPAPSTEPSSTPSLLPTADHISDPAPSTEPSSTPSLLPTAGDPAPSTEPSSSPSLLPTAGDPAPSTEPSSTPTLLPTAGDPAPSTEPSSSPSLLPTAGDPAPSTEPSSTPTLLPTAGDPAPSTEPSSSPSLLPTAGDPAPSTEPSSSPSLLHSSVPSLMPSVLPSTAPSKLPTTVPSELPSASPPGLDGTAGNRAPDNPFLVMSVEGSEDACKFDYELQKKECKSAGRRYKDTQDVYGKAMDKMHDAHSKIKPFYEALVAHCSDSMSFCEFDMQQECRKMEEAKCMYLFAKATKDGKSLLRRIKDDGKVEYEDTKEKDVEKYIEKGYSLLSVRTDCAEQNSPSAPVAPTIFNVIPEKNADTSRTVKAWKLAKDLHKEECQSARKRLDKATEVMEKIGKEVVEMDGDESEVLTFYSYLQETAAAKVMMMNDMVNMRCQEYETAVSELNKLTNSDSASSSSGD